MNEFEIALNRYEKAYRLMKKKEQLKRELPPRGSSFYRYFSDPEKNPPSYDTLCKQIDSLTE
jgi:hypothetical protein